MWGRKVILDKKVIDEINGIEDFKDRVHQAAIAYAKQGLYVIPLKPGTRIPVVPRGGKYADYSTKEPDVADRWFGPNGRYRGYNIGLSCGATDGIFVVDVDIHGDKNGFESLEELCPDGLDAPCQTTPNGGKHYVFNWSPGATPSSDKIGRGIDTRGGDGELRSHIAAWPSIVEEGGYEWVEGGEIPDVPSWVMDKMGETWERKKPGRGNEEVDEDALETQFPLRELWVMLASVNPGSLSYDEWLRVGQAIHSQHPTEDGLRCWDLWSQKGIKSDGTSAYMVGECAKRWGGFKSEGTVRIGTLIKVAMDNGWVPQPIVIEKTDKDDELAEMKEVVAELNEEWAIVIVGGKVRVLATKLSREPDRDLVLMTVDDFKNATMNKRTLVTNAQGKPTVVPKSAVWLVDPNRKEFPMGITFYPGKPTEFDGYFNQWGGWSMEPKAGDWSKLRNHIFEIICRKNQSHFEWLLDWMADMLQDPANPKGTAVVMKGPEGAGKGMFMNAMGKMMGRHYKHLTQERHLTGNFNAHLGDALLVFADEAIYGGCRKTAGSLKSIVTEDRLILEKKGIDAVSYRNCMRLGIASNEDWFIPAGPQSRRWFVLEVSGLKIDDRKYFDAIFDEMDDGGVEAMMHDLMKREIKNDLRKAPETELLFDQRASYSASDSMVQWWTSCLEKGDPGVQPFNCSSLDVQWPQEVSRVELYEKYEEWAMVRRLNVIPKPRFYSKMVVYGLSPYRPKSGDGRTWVFKVPDLDTAKAKFRAESGVDIDVATSCESTLDRG